MTLSSPNEPTIGPGEKPVYDAEGLYVGRVRADEEVPPPSEDLARVLVHLSQDAIDALSLKADAVDVEATWLAPTDDGERLVLDRPLRAALVEQGFDL